MIEMAVESPGTLSFASPPVYCGAHNWRIVGRRVLAWGCRQARWRRGNRLSVTWRGEIAGYEGCLSGNLIEFVAVSVLVPFAVAKHAALVYRKRTGKLRGTVYLFIAQRG
jgi:hypothetical protein